MRKYVTLFILSTTLAMTATILLSQPVQAMGNASGGLSAGYYSINTWDPEIKEHIALHVWYPSTSRERRVTLSPYRIFVARNGKPAEGTFPFLLISHATAESGLAHHNTAAALARRGYVVAAPTHPGDNLQDTRRTLSPEQLAGRLRQLPSVMETILRQKKVGPIIDNSRIAIIGYGVGATAGLILAGAIPYPAKIQSYCEKHQEESMYCTPWATQRFNTFKQELVVTEKGWKDDRIKAVAAIAPGYGMLFAVDSFVSLNIPVLVVSAGKNRLNPPQDHVLPLQKILPPSTQFQTLPEADEYSFLSPCSKRMTRRYNQLCERKKIKKESNTFVLDTLQNFLTSSLSSSSH